MEIQFMKTVVQLLVLIPALVVLSVFAKPLGRPVAADDACTNSIFTPVLESLRTKTSVPLRLPLVVADEYDAALYAEVGWASPARYVIKIGQNCERSYCPFGTVSGMKVSEQTAQPKGNVVKLSGGITGYLTDGSKRSKDTVITWDEGQYRYAITLYAAEPAAIIKVANSALSCDNR
jgi:hypothetical protein